MLKAVLTRTELTEAATQGVLAFPGQSNLFLYTLERPWLFNQFNLSCIPEGNYTCELRKSPRFGYCYWVRGTAPRTWILIHSGNIVAHTHGCILPGLRRGRVSAGPAVFNSRSALSELHQLTDNKPFQLEIVRGISG